MENNNEFINNENYEEKNEESICRREFDPEPAYLDRKYDCDYSDSKSEVTSTEEEGTHFGFAEGGLLFLAGTGLILGGKFVYDHVVKPIWAKVHGDDDDEYDDEEDDEEERPRKKRQVRKKNKTSNRKRKTPAPKKRRKEEYDDEYDEDDEEESSVEVDEE